MQRASGGDSGKKTCFRVEVIEARNRTGGRIFTVPLGEDKILVDSGASWIHGIGRRRVEEDLDGRYKDQWNPIYKLCKQNKIQTSRTWC